MSTVNCSLAGLVRRHALAGTLAAVKRPLHRLRSVRRSEGISQIGVARRLKISLDEVQRQEQETTDLPLSTLYQWQAVLQVPLMEILIEPEEPLSPPVMKRAQMVRAMKTAQAILQRTRQLTIRRLAQTLVEQLTEIMPELQSVTPWPDIGQPRSLNELGQAANRCVSDDLLVRPFGGTLECPTDGTADSA